MEASQPILSMLSSTVPNFAQAMHPCAFIKCMNSDLDWAALGL